MDFSPKQTKSATVKGILQSQNISSLINEALQSPMGSTSRKKAQKIAGLMTKLRQQEQMASMGMDGMGGPGYMNQQQQQQFAQAQPVGQMGEMVIFPFHPEMAISQDGRGGPGFPGIWTPPTTGASTGQPTALSNLQNFSNNVGQQAAVPQAPGSSTSAFEMPALKPQGGLAMAAQQPPTGVTPPASAPSSALPWNNLKMGAVTNPPAKLSVNTNPTNPAGQQPSTGTPTGSTGSTTGVATSNTVQNAVNANQGPDAFALSMLGNPDALRTLPGFANMPASAIPTGASLSGQIDVLAKTLQDEYNLDELLNQKNAMIKSGITLDMNMTDYIRGRDQFLNQTQGMIDQYTEKMRTADLANPNTAARANQYMNYLYELRGRQNKRYIEFLNGSISMYNAQLQDVSSNYDKALAAYESELTLKTGVTQAEYQMYYNALTGMYNAAQQAPILAKQAQLLDAQINATTAQTIKDAANQNKGLLEDFNTIRTKGEGLIVDKDGNLLPSVTSLIGAVNTLSGDGSVAPYSALQFMVSGMTNGLQNAPDPVTASQLGKKYLGWAAELYKNASQGGGDQDLQMASQIRNTLQGTLSSNLSKTISADVNSLTALRDDLNNMANPGFFKKGPSQQSFSARYTPLLGKDVADALWGGMNQFKNDGGRIELPKTTNVNELANFISDIAADNYVANIWATSIAQ